MSSRKDARSSISHRKTVRNIGRRFAGSWGRATHKLRAVANRATRRVAKAELRKNHE